MTSKNENGMRAIPVAAMVIAALVFLCSAVLFSWVFANDQTPPPLPLQIFLVLLASVVMAAYALLAGYVFRDARRRGMRHVAWTFIVLLVPNGIGFILYFLLRQPLLGRCPRCQATVKPEFNYCPACDQQLKPVCAKCGRTAEAGSVFCPYCGSGFSGPGLASVPPAKAGSQS